MSIHSCPCAVLRMQAVTWTLSPGGAREPEMLPTTGHRTPLHRLHLPACRLLEENDWSPAVHTRSTPLNETHALPLSRRLPHCPIRACAAHEAGRRPDAAPGEAGNQPFMALQACRPCLRLEIAEAMANSQGAARRGGLTRPCLSFFSILADTPGHEGGRCRCWLHPGLSTRCTPVRGQPTPHTRLITALLSFSSAPRTNGLTVQCSCLGTLDVWRRGRKARQTAAAPRRHPAHCARRPRHVANLDQIGPPGAEDGGQGTWSEHLDCKSKRQLCSAQAQHSWRL